MSVYVFVCVCVYVLMCAFARMCVCVFVNICVSFVRHRHLLVGRKTKRETGRGEMGSQKQTERQRQTKRCVLQAKFSQETILRNQPHCGIHVKDVRRLQASA